MNAKYSKPNVTIITKTDGR